ncbi:unnamed protein product [Didymodactylos carnosus]|uniref:Peptidase metallopeptidase domain-containing protein n=1 Tax=Didymodactylos carnosus TaxID=1234261 RepID=A0A814AG99_9BILA|nr:unnamed protein product [Didymodactylos carnosus]CAF1022568.1 unnamed protein product [Didymodactylos carnosus]CAF3693866.1 unnamed protein product [Didymodactylos carnosus]CAF3791069.1 unnamed protein product [Didymodactylos carnosus]
MSGTDNLLKCARHIYLSKYGYLPRSDLETRALRTDHEIYSAIRRLQHYAGVPVTGKLDETTVKLIRRPRCGLPDFDNRHIQRPQSFGNRKKRYVLQGQKWAKTYLTYKITNYTPDMSRESVDRAIYHALLIWSYPSMLRFRAATEHEEPDIEFLFAQGYHEDGYRFDGKGAVLAHAFYPDEYLGGDVHYDEDEDWTAYRENEYGLMDLFSVTVHELGHSLGLMHSNIPDAIMFPYYRGYSPDIKLHSDDIAGIRTLYGEPPQFVPPPIESQTVVTSPMKDIEQITTLTDTISTVTTIDSLTPVVLVNTTAQTPIILDSPTTLTTASTTTTVKNSILRAPESNLKAKNTFTSSPTQRTTTNSINRAHTRTDRPSIKSTALTPVVTNRTSIPTTMISKETNIYRYVNEYPSSIDKEQYITLDICDGYYDAVTMYHGNLFIFKGQYHWQFDSRGLNPYSPMLNNAFWLGLPENLNHIDAAFERSDGLLMLFSANQYWLFENNLVYDSTYPRNLITLGLPRHVKRVDAAFYWKYNSHAYLVWENLYWAFNEQENLVQRIDYPRDMKMWQGIDIPLDDAFVDMTGNVKRRSHPSPFCYNELLKYV